MSVLPRPTRRIVALLAATASLGACAEEPAVTAPPTSTTSTGPRVVWDLGHRPLPEVPLPNDIATYPDQNSPTGLRSTPRCWRPRGSSSGSVASSTNSTAGARIKGSMCRSPRISISATSCDATNTTTSRSPTTPCT